MNRQSDEQLSALLDGEVSGEELDLLLARLDRNDGCRDTLARYDYIGAMLRGEDAVPLAGFHHRVRARLITESAPARERPVRGRPGRSGRSGWSSWAGAALAATVVAGAVIVGLPRALRFFAQPVEMASTAPRGGASPVQQAMNPRSAPLRVATLAPARLTTYLVAHGAYASDLSQPAWESRVINGQMEQVTWPGYRNGE